MGLLVGQMLLAQPWQHGGHLPEVCRRVGGQRDTYGILHLYPFPCERAHTRDIGGRHGTLGFRPARRPTRSP